MGYLPLFSTFTQFNRSYKNKEFKDELFPELESDDSFLDEKPIIKRKKKHLLHSTSFKHFLIIFRGRSEK